MCIRNKFSQKSYANIYIHRHNLVIPKFKIRVNRGKKVQKYFFMNRIETHSAV